MELTAEMASDIFKKGVSDAKSKKTNDSDEIGRASCRERVSSTV